MPMLYANCPITGSKIETGVRTDDHSLAIMANSKMAIFCDKCSQHHKLRVSDLFCLPAESGERAA